MLTISLYYFMNGRVKILKNIHEGKKTHFSGPVRLCQKIKDCSNEHNSDMNKVQLFVQEGSLPTGQILDHFQVYNRKIQTCEIT